MKRKITAVALTLVLVLLCFVLQPVTAQAATVASGECGENLTWVLDDKGTLTISGTGPMTSYVHPESGNTSQAPWYSRRMSIKTIVIENGVTEIGAYAFFGCVNLTDVTIPKSVTELQPGVFYDCAGLKQIVIPEGVVLLEDDMFTGCRSLEKVYLPASLGHLSATEFVGCDNLIGIYVDENNERYVSDSAGALYDTMMGWLQKVPAKHVGSYEILDGFASIANYAFHNCTGLTSVTIPKGLTEIGEVPFLGCYNLERIDVDADHKYLSSDSDGVLYDKDKTYLYAVPCAFSGKYVIADGVCDIGINAFVSCSRLTEIVIPDSVNSFAQFAFYDCGSLEKFSVDAKNTVFCNDSKGNLLSKDKTVLLAVPKAISGTYTVPSGVTTIDSYAFQSCEKLIKIIVTDGVKHINTNSFDRCSGMQTILLPTSLESMAISYNFNNAKALHHMLYAGTKAQCDAFFGRAYKDLPDVTWHYNATGDEISIVTYQGQTCTYCSVCDQYFDANGKRIGWAKENGQWVYYKDGEILKNSWAKDGSKWCYLGADGYMVTDKWVKDGSKWCYVDKYGYMVTNKWVKDGTKWCYVDKYGYMVTNGWAKDGSVWRWMNQYGYITYSKWVHDGYGWCYINSKGYMDTNKWVKDGSKWCYIGADGYQVFNKWVKDGSKWCYVGADGYMVTNKWAKDGSKWCYVGADGYMVTNKWVKDGSKWCYVGADGYQVFNKWVKDGSKWCYVGADGYQVFNKWVKDGKYWAYIGKDGYMATNKWIDNGSSWSYVDKYGHALTGTHTIDGKTYTFDANGNLTR